jgi:hypothetical protein
MAKKRLSEMNEPATISSSETSPASRPSAPAKGLIEPLEKTGDEFQYKPLPRNVDSIRLITLNPHEENEDDSIVRCELSHVTFGEKPQYEA